MNHYGVQMYHKNGKYHYVVDGTYAISVLNIIVIVIQMTQNIEFYLS